MEYSVHERALQTWVAHMEKKYKNRRKETLFFGPDTCLNISELLKLPEFASFQKYNNSTQSRRKENTIGLE